MIYILKIVLIGWSGNIDTDADGFDGRVNADGILKNEPQVSTDQFAPKRFKTTIWFSPICENCFIEFFCILKNLP